MYKGPGKEALESPANRRRGHARLACTAADTPMSYRLQGARSAMPRPWQTVRAIRNILYIQPNSSGPSPF